jgi:hypothetical protein
MTADLRATCTAGEARILTLVIVDGMTQAQAARVLACSRANVCQTLTRALRKLSKANVAAPHIAVPEPRQQATPIPPATLARYIELVELSAVIAEAPDRIERDAGYASGGRAVDLGEPLGSRSGGRKRRGTRNNLSRWELEFVRDHGRPSGLWYHDHEALRLDEHGHHVARERRDYADRDGQRRTAPKRRPVNTQRLVRDKPK